MKRILLVCVVLVSMVSFQATAEELMQNQAAAEEFKPKRNEVSIFGNVDTSTQSSDAPGSKSTSSTTIYVSGEYGRYFTSKLVGKVGVFVLGSGTGANELSLLNVGIGLKYYFINGKRVSPFIMGDIGIATMEAGGFSSSGYMADFAPGIAIWLTEATALNLQWKLKTEKFSSSASTYISTTNHVMFELGLTTKF